MAEKLATGLITRIGKLIGSLIPKKVENNMKPDQVTLNRIEEIHPVLRAELGQIYKEICEALSGKLGCRFVQVYRSIEYQNELYAQGRTKPGQKVTDAKGGYSYHNHGLGVDFCLTNDKNNDGKITSDEIVWDRNTDIDGDSLKDWIEVVNVFKKYGWVWGDRWNDYPHFEKSFGYKPSQLLTKYNAGQVTIDNGRKYVKL